ncbi:unnamed protein product [Calypogeia fissa]
MSGQLRASSALSGSAALPSAPYNPARGRGVHAGICPIVFNPLGSSIPQPVSSASLRCTSATGGYVQPAVTSSKHERSFLGSSFWSTSVFNRKAWEDNGRDGAKEEKRRKRCGVARAAGTAGKGTRKSASGVKPTKPGQFVLIFIAVAYMTILVFIPFINVFVQAFSNGITPFIQNLLDPDFQHAVKMTCLIAGIVVPINTVFGLVMAIWVARYEFPFKAVLMTCLDLPFSISPVVVGLMLMLLYGRQGIFAPLLRAWNIEIVFALPGMVLATCFVTLPFVVREVIPVLLEMDPFEEEAARTMGASEWEVFTQVTFPNIRLGLLYGITLCNARAMGEFGAVSVISGNIVGKTQTLTLFVEAAYKEYNTQGAFSAALLLSVFALFTLIIKTKLEDERAKQLSFR